MDKKTRRPRTNKELSELMKGYWDPGYGYKANWNHTIVLLLTEIALRLPEYKEPEEAKENESDT